VSGKRAAGRRCFLGQVRAAGRGALTNLMGSDDVGTKGEGNWRVEVRDFLRQRPVPDWKYWQIATIVDALRRRGGSDKKKRLTWAHILAKVGGGEKVPRLRVRQSWGLVVKYLLIYPGGGAGRGMVEFWGPAKGVNSST